MDTKRRGRQCRVPGEPSTCRVELCLTARERAAILQVAHENHLTVAEMLREAVNEFVQDYRERGVFDDLSPVVNAASVQS